MQLTTANLLKTEATTAAADICNIAVALAERPAAKVSFQRQAPTFPPTQNDDSAVSPVPTATHFSGFNAKTAKMCELCNSFTQFASNYVLLAKSHPSE